MLTCVARVLHQAAAVFDGRGAAAERRPDGRPVVAVFLPQPEHKRHVYFKIKLTPMVDVGRFHSRLQLLNLLGGVPEARKKKRQVNLRTQGRGVFLSSPPAQLTCRRGSCCRTCGELACRRRTAAC